MIEVLETTVKLVAATAPNMTAVAPVKYLPVIVTVLPPTVEPVAGSRPVISGTGRLKVNRSALTMALCLPEVLRTRTCTMPTAWRGLMTVSLVADFT